MRIRQATVQDLNGIMALYRMAADAMVGTPYDCRWRSDGRPTPEFVGSLVQSGGMLVAEDGDVLADCVGIDHDLGHDYDDLSYQASVPEELVAVVHLLAVRDGLAYMDKTAYVHALAQASVQHSLQSTALQVSHDE